MKKALSFILALSLFLTFSTCFAESAEMTGVFVPDYNTFMNRLCDGMSNTGDFVSVLKNKLFIDGNWKNNMFGTNLVGTYTFELSSEESVGYLDEFEIYINFDLYSKYSEEFKSIIKAAILAIRPDFNDEDVAKIFDALYYDYIIASPVSGTSQSCNCGIYRFYFSKSSDRYTFSMNFSLYDYS